MVCHVPVEPTVTQQFVVDVGLAVAKPMAATLVK
jgi:hypothetical protein